MFKSAKTIFAVFGKPILHSRSPHIFNTVFEHEQKNALYTRIRTTNAEDITNIMRKFEISCANITTPFKENVCKYVDIVTDEALQIHGINVIINSNGILTGYNTDFVGVIKSFEEQAIVLKNSDCLVLGAGAAARAAVFGLIQKGANVAIANRTIEKARQTAKKYGCKAIDLSELKHNIKNYQIIVSALIPQVNPLDGIILPKNMIILDANYFYSGIEKYALKYGCRFISGQEWLLNQAKETYNLFFGYSPDKSVMRQGLNKSIQPEAINCLNLNHNSNNIDFENVDIAIFINSDNKTDFNNSLNEEKNRLLNC